MFGDVWRRGWTTERELQAIEESFFAGRPFPLRSGSMTDATGIWVSVDPHGIAGTGHVEKNYLPDGFSATFKAPMSVVRGYQLLTDLCVALGANPSSLGLKVSGQQVAMPSSICRAPSSDGT